MYVNYHYTRVVEFHTRSNNAISYGFVKDNIHELRLIAYLGLMEQVGILTSLVRPRPLKTALL
jgi:hypothetical protein